MAVETKEFRAEARFQRVSPQKARLVLELIKGRGVEEALTTAAFTKKRIAPVIHKLLTSAVDNAKYFRRAGSGSGRGQSLRQAGLANDGPRMKRIRPAPMGRAFRYQRRLDAHQCCRWPSARAAGLATKVEEPWRQRQSSPRPPRLQRQGKDGSKGGEPKGAAKKAAAPKKKAVRRPRGFLRGSNMGQKVHPYGFRLGVNKPWRSRWFSERDYDKLLVEDVKLKAELREKLKAAGVSSVEIERPGNKLRFLIRTARPGIVIGRKGAEIEKLKTELGKRTSRDVFIDIIEVNKPELDAQLVSENIALQLEKRVSFRRAMRKSVDSALRFGCKGIKVRVSGR
jgi:ribosomal protein S3/ribosomal protein L22